MYGTEDECLSFTKPFLTCLAERRASSACGTSAESKHPEDVSFTTLFQGVLLKTLFFSIILFHGDGEWHGFTKPNGSIELFIRVNQCDQR
jgi:hypothetical protein